MIIPTVRWNQTYISWARQRRRLRSITQLLSRHTLFTADPSGRAGLGVGLRPLACWEQGFECRRGSRMWLLWVLWRGLRRADHSSGGVIPNVLWRLQQCGGLGPLRAAKPWQKKIKYHNIKKKLQTDIAEHNGIHIFLNVPFFFFCLGKFPK